MITLDQALSSLPNNLRRLLLDEYTRIVNNFKENRWGPSELSGGRFCEIVYTIIRGYATGTYPSTPLKPRNFVDACRCLEANSGVTRSFRILIPRLLPALYEIRSNRGVGHIGGEVDPNFMDSSVVVSVASWIVAELIRVFHNISTSEAQVLVDSLVERRLPLIWKSGEIRRVLKPDLSLKDQILLLVASCSAKATADKVYEWTGYDKRAYFKRLVRDLHKQRYIEFDETSGELELLPPGSEYVSKLLSAIT